MPFHVHRDETIGHGIGRMARDELDGARKSILSGRSVDDAVHDVRSAIKKVRALVRCIRPAVGKPAKEANRRLRSIAPDLAPARDAHTVATTLSGLAHGIGGPHGEDIARARRKLATRMRRDASKASPSRLRKVADRLERVRDGALGHGRARARTRSRRRRALSRSCSSERSGDKSSGRE